MTATAGDHSPPSELWVGPYRLVARIGEGGMGVVHLGQRETGERAAIKVLRPHVVSDDEARARLAREVNSLGRVRSPRVAEIVEADPWGPIPYVATRYVPGLPLHRHVREEGVLEGEELRHLASGLAQALAAVHEVGVLHRDIKPSNVLMEGRNPVLIDFGLARLDDDLKVTRTGYLLGTPGYIAPEILFGEEPTPAADVHSWAATVAFAGLGRPPFGSGHALVVMDRVRRGEHDLDGLEPGLRGLLLAALDPTPAQRPRLDEVLGVLGADPRTAPLADVPPTLPFAAVPTADPRDSAEPVTLVEEAAPPTLVDAPRPAPAPPVPPPWEPPTIAATNQPYQQPPAATAMPRPPQAATSPFGTQPERPWAERVTWVERLRRGVLAGTAVGVLAGLTALLPWVAAFLVVAAVCLLRAGSLAGSSLAARRQARGRKWYDGTLAVLAAPWHFVVSLIGTGALLVWAGLLVACALLVLLALGAADHVALTGAGVVLAASLWTGPGSSRIRSPLRRVGLPMAARALPWAIWTAVLVLVAAGLLAGATAGPQWWPTTASPWADGTWLGRWL